MAHVSVVGAGQWGTTIAQILAENGHRVTLWCYKQSIADAISTGRTHHRLPGIALSELITATTDISACYDCDGMILGLSSAQIEANECGIDWKKITSPLLILAKGVIEPHDFISQVLSARVTGPVGVLSGPNLALEIATKLPAASVIAFEKPNVASDFQLWLSNQYFRCYTTTDVIGVQVGGVFKNVFAIAAGCVDGLGLGANAKSALITRGLNELQQLCEWFGGQPSTIMGLSGLGDLIATCHSPQSRNYQLGQRVSTMTMNDALHQQQSVTTEGLRSIQRFNEHPVNESLDLPIMNAVARMVLFNEPPKQLISELMKRGLKSEFNG